MTLERLPAPTSKKIEPSKSCAGSSPFSQPEKRMITIANESHPVFASEIFHESNITKVFRIHKAKSLPQEIPERLSILKTEQRAGFKMNLHIYTPVEVFYSQPD